jgi:hypothetical protein
MEAPKTGAELNLRTNSALAAVTRAVQDFGLPPQAQVGILTMALALALRRFFVENRIGDRGRRLRMIKTVAAEIESKLRKFSNPSE